MLGSTQRPIKGGTPFHDHAVLLTPHTFLITLNKIAVKMRRRQAALAPVRSHGRPHAARRRRPTGVRRGGPAQGDGCDLPGLRALRADRGREYRHGAGGGAGRSRASAGGSRPASSLAEVSTPTTAAPLFARRRATTPWPQAKSQMGRPSTLPIRSNRAGSTRSWMRALDLTLSSYHSAISS
jgi:hypothetical protein